MRICIKNLNRQEVRECYYAHVDDLIEPVLTLHVTGANIKIEFTFLDKDEATSVLKTLLTTGYYDFENRDYKVTELN